MKNLLSKLALGAGLVTLSATAGLVGCGGDDESNNNPPTEGGADVVTPPGDGGDDGGDGGGPGLGPVAPGPSNGSAIATSPDESIVVSVSRDTGLVSVFTADYTAGAKLTKKKDIDLGADAEPWQVAISSNGKYAYVVCRRSQKLVRIDGLTGDPVKGAEVAVGSEPTGVALTSRSGSAWVTNWVDGTVSVVDTAKMTVSRTINLNKVIAPLLGQPGADRPALAHPRSIAITNDGNDNEDDETAYVTEYYGVRTDQEGADGATADTSKSGFVYAVKVGSGDVSTIKLGPLGEMGFVPTVGGSAGCFPNQLQSITVNGKYAYVLSVCASPRGPLGVRTTAATCDFSAPNPNSACNGVLNIADGVCLPNNTCVDVASVKTSTAPLLSVIDLSNNTEIAASRSNLAKVWFDRYSTANPSVPNDASRRVPIVANDLTFVPKKSVAYVSSNGSDAVFRVTFENGAIKEIGGNAQQHFINLAPDAADETKNGRLPMGVVATSKEAMFAANDTSRNVSIIALPEQAQTGVVATAPAPTGDALKVVRGRRFFNTGLGRWSLRGQGWGSCQSCHIDGLSDNVTWYFGRGSRQSTSLDGSFSKDGNTQRIFNWTAIFDDVSDFEGNTRGTSGGIGAIVNNAALAATSRIDQATAVAGQRHDGLNGSSRLFQTSTDEFNLGAGAKPILNDWEEIEMYIKSIRAPRGSKAVDAAKVAAGKALFTTHNCNGCHGGALWTTSELFYKGTARNAANAFATTEALQSAQYTAGAGFPQSATPNDNLTGNMRTAANTGNDSLTCALREVNTFGRAEGAEVAENGNFPELRQDMTTAGQGGNSATGRGFSPPSLLGVSVGGPYLHHGGARTLEALFGPAYAQQNGHHRVLSTNFLDGTNAATDAQQRTELIHFLLSIDDDTAVIAAPATSGAKGGVLCAPPP